MFKKNQRSIMLAYSAIPLVLLIDLLTSHYFNYPLPRGNFKFNFFLLTIIIPLIAWVITFGEFNPNKTMAGFPRFTFTHPYSSTKLALIPITFAILFSFTFVTLWFSVIAHKDFNLSQYNLIFITCFIAVVWLEYIAWRLFNAPLRTVSLFLFLIVSLSLFFVSLWHTEISTPLINRNVASVGLLIMSSLGLWLAINAVKSARTGQIIDKQWRFSDVQLFGFGLPQNYLSKQQAIFRFEWRVFGWMLPFASLFLGTFFLFLVFKSDSNLKGTDMLFLMIIFLFYVPFFSPSVFCKTHLGSKSNAILSFSARLPLSNFDLSISKLKLALKSNAVFFLVTLTPINIHLLMMTSENNEMRPWHWLSTNFGEFNSLLVWLAANLMIPIISWAVSSNVISWLVKGKSIFNIRLMTYAFSLVTLIVLIAVRINSSEAFRLTFISYLPLFNTIAFLALVFIFSQAIKKFRAFYKVGYSLENKTLNKVIFWVTGLLSYLLLTLWLVSSVQEVNFHMSLILFDLAIMLILPILKAPFSIKENRSR